MGGSRVEVQAQWNNRPLHHNSVSTDHPPTTTTPPTVNNNICPTLRGDFQGDPSLVYVFQQVVGVTRRVKLRKGGVTTSLKLGFQLRGNRLSLFFSVLMCGYK